MKSLNSYGSLKTQPESSRVDTHEIHRKPLLINISATWQWRRARIESTSLWVRSLLTERLGVWHFWGSEMVRGGLRDEEEVEGEGVGDGGWEVGFSEIGWGTEGAGQGRRWVF
ncbi:unnamed protein product [Prunus armeniaca]